MKGKKIIAAVVVVLCAAAFYFCYWMKTPTYSLGLIQDAVEAHDVVKFQKHVNLNHLIGKAYDDSITLQEEILGEEIRNDRFTMLLMERMKPAIVNGLENAILSRIEGKKHASSSYTSTDSGMFNNLSEEKTEVKNISVKEVQDGVAHVALTLNNRNITVKMIELEDGTWRVEEIVNISEFFSETEKEMMRMRMKSFNAILNRM